MKKLFSAIMCFVLILTAVPLALAEEICIPDITLFYSDDIEHIYTDETSGFRAYVSTDVEAMLESIVGYCGLLCTEYGFANVEFDTESSDTFVYIYVKDYNGSSDVEPEYLDNCPTPCSVLFGITTADDEFVAIIAMADGISISDTPVAGEGAGAYVSDITGADSYDHAVLPDPGLFFNCSRMEDKHSDPHQCELVSYRFNMDNGGFDAVEEFINMLEAGGYHLTRTNYVASDYMDVTGQIFVDYTYRYDGPYEVGSYINWDDEWDGDVHILIGYYYDRGEIGLTFYYGEGFSLVDSGLRTTQTLVDRSGNSSVSSGSSWDDDDEAVPECNICWGSGESTCDTCWGSGQVSSSATSSGRETCDDCRGRGRDTCWACGGSGDLY